MAGELVISFAPSRTVYFLIFNRSGQIWNTSSSAFEAYATANLASYKIAGTQQGTSSSFYLGTFPTAISAGVYGIAAKLQIAGSEAETDPTIGVEDFHWNGSATFPLSDIPVSGFIGQHLPIRIARGTQILNFPVHLVSAADHVTSFTSGVVSGQIARDAGSFGALQSGAFTEIGLGWYNLQALTSGDLLANTIKLNFTAAGISGGTSDPRNYSLILQRVSGQ